MANLNRIAQPVDHASWRGVDVVVIGDVVVDLDGDGDVEVDATVGRTGRCPTDSLRAIA